MPPSKAEFLREILEMEKRRAVLLARQERLGPFRLLVLGSGLSGGLVSVALLGWLLALPIRGHAVEFALSTTVLAVVGFASAGLIHLGKPQLSVPEAAQLAELDRDIAQRQAAYRQLT